MYIDYIRTKRIIYLFGRRDKHQNLKHFVQWLWILGFEGRSFLLLFVTQKLLGGGFKHFLFSPLPGEMIQFGLFFSDGLKPPTRLREVEVCFLPKNPPCPQTPKKATLMKSLCGWSRQPLGVVGWFLDVEWKPSRNRDAPASCNQRVRDWKVSRMILVQSFSNRISMAQHLQSSITICQRKHPQIVDFEAVSRHLFCSVWWNIPMEFSQPNSMVFWGQKCQEDCLGGWSKAASWIGEFLPPKWWFRFGKHL